MTGHELRADLAALDASIRELSEQVEAMRSALAALVVLTRSLEQAQQRQADSLARLALGGDGE